MSALSDEQRMAWAHWARVSVNIEEIPVSDRVALGLSSLALLADALMSDNPMAVQERARVTIALLDPRN